jgi:hypothetical protein
VAGGWIDVTSVEWNANGSESIAPDSFHSRNSWLEFFSAQMDADALRSRRWALMRKEFKRE